jgi:hypothetical protein
VEDWAEIRRLHRAEGMPIKVIARTPGAPQRRPRALRRRSPGRFKLPEGTSLRLG